MLPGCFQKEPMTTPVFEITKAAAFDAAHFIAVGPADSSYRRMHGHSFKVEATVRGHKQDPTGAADRADALGRGADDRACGADGCAGDPDRRAGDRGRQAALQEGGEGQPRDENDGSTHALFLPETTIEPPIPGGSMA